ncbi:MAG TPA: hypothetical protein VGV92_00140 [Gammaproteobacteria bacterium]|nr:hypothetical protein [Gammaproteobacteria bacterium]
MAEILETTQKRPCCLLLRELTEALPSLTTPEKTAEVLDTISQHCVLMKLVGRSKTKIDFSKGACFLAVNPDEAQSVITEAQKTAEAFNELAHFEELFNKINQILANNANLKDIGDKIQLFLAQMREGERRFGAVPFTDIHRDQKAGHGLSAGESLQSHPLIADKPQFDGIDPKSNPDTQINPEAAENAARLQLELSPQLRQQLQLQHGLAAAPKFTPKGG